MAAGALNESGWWSQRWRSYLLDDVQSWSPTEAKLKSGLRAEASVTFSRGKVTAVVKSGSHGQTYTATFKVKPLGEREWRRVLDALTAAPDVAHLLLTGRPGPELETLLAGAGVALLPEPTVRLPLRCTCREAWGCRHINALITQGAQMVEGNPFLWLAALGKGREELLGALRARLADSGAGAEAAMGDAEPTQRPPDPERFWTTPENPDTIAVRPGAAAAPDAILRLLGPLPLPDAERQVPVMAPRRVGKPPYDYEIMVPVDRPAEDLLRGFAGRIGQGAAELARGERSPIYRAEALPGKPVPLRSRLAAEIAALAEEEGRVIRFEELFTACPTAAALPPHERSRAVSDALLALPPELVTTADRYVSTPEALLDGAVFHHVVTCDEWLTGSPDTDADWVRALAAAGCPGPYAVPVAGERLEVGDELRITVIDPAQPRLSATVVRRQSRSPGQHQAVSREAADLLVEYLTAIGLRRLRESEAVAVLLAEGRYREGADPGPVWLLPESAGLISHEGAGRGLTLDSWHTWQPVFSRRWAQPWQGREAALSRFSASLSAQGEGVQRTKAALRCADLWTRRFPGPHDQPGKTPPLADFLHFLWQTAPVELDGRAAAEAPDFLAAWFAFLGEQQPDLQPAYREHLAVCGQREAYAVRLATRPGAGKKVEMAAWRAEGYRWLGPKRFFAQ